MIPSIGRIVHYKLTASDADAINRRRADAESALSEHRANANGVLVHSGNRVSEGDIYPLMITRVWADADHLSEGTAVNGQVHLDGNDTLWVTSRTQGDEGGRWFEAPRV